MVVVGTPGLYHFAGALVTVPASGEVDVDEKTAEAMKAVGFKGKPGRKPADDKAPD
jgi:hypothetical protein